VQSFAKTRKNKNKNKNSIAKFSFVGKKIAKFQEKI
jgi:hypothetical protein